jgi:hypothetical protein
MRAMTVRRAARRMSRTTVAAIIAPGNVIRAVRHFLETDRRLRDLMNGATTVVAFYVECRQCAFAQAVVNKS